MHCSPFISSTKSNKTHATSNLYLLKTMTNISRPFKLFSLLSKKNISAKVIILLLYIIYSGSDLKRPKINVNCYPFNNLILFLHTKHADLTSWKSSYQSILKSQNILPTWSIDIQHLTFGIMSCMKVILQKLFYLVQLFTKEYIYISEI